MNRETTSSKLSFSNNAKKLEQYASKVKELKCYVLH